MKEFQYHLIKQLFLSMIQHIKNTYETQVMIFVDE